MENDKCRRRVKWITRRNAGVVSRKNQMGTCSKIYAVRKKLTESKNNAEGAPSHHTPCRVSQENKGTHIAQFETDLPK